jgi:malonyl CoA-acyl carrier protein transacylase
MFPGQPLSLAAPLPDDRDFTEIARMTEKKTTLDLGSLAWKYVEQTENIKFQVYGSALSLYRNRLLIRQGVKPNIVAEHSMGIYSALAACGSISEEDALELTFRIGACFARLGEKDDYALGCVIGMTHEPLSAIASNNGVYMANLNTSRHFILSGKACNMIRAMEESLANGAFSASTFPCDAPLHSPLMEEVAAPLAEICGEFCYREPLAPLINHVDQERLTAAKIADFLVRELCVPVFWERTYLALQAAGVGKYFEAGAGDALKKYNRWIHNENFSG